MLKKILEYISDLWYSKIGIREYRRKNMSRGFSALDIANWFVWYNQVQKMEHTNEEDSYDVYEGLTHLKIQKLLYFAEGVCLATFNKQLFKEKIYAWPHGPVVKDVYEKLCENGSKEIEFKITDYPVIQDINSNADIYNLLVSVYDSYAGYTAWQLREKSHVPGGPWQITVDTKGMQKEIDKNLIKDYFKKIVKVENGYQ